MSEIRDQKLGRQGRKRGFTLIELMVATAILVIITLIVARIFQQASSSWRTGSEKVEIVMNGRAVADFIAQELSLAIPDTNGTAFSVSGLPLNFQIIGDATPTNRAIYKLGEPGGFAASDLADGIIDVKIDTFGNAPVGGLPAYGIVTVKMTNDVIFQSGVYFQNRDRNRL